MDAAAEHAIKTVNSANVVPPVRRQQEVFMATVTTHSHHADVRTRAAVIADIASY